MTETTHHFASIDDASDYGDFGSDAEEIQILDGLLAQVVSASKEDRATNLLVTDIEDYEPPQGLLLLAPPNTSTGQPHPQINIASQTEVLRDFETDDTDKRREASREREASPTVNAEPDNRPPLERFRKPPKKALSVTDLVSPAWCELQYFYTLSKHGRKRRTPAMKQGSAVHKALEDEVHITVPIETTKKEDSWGLRIWNICQGLKTLRQTGRTRELEIWGTVGGELVNGIIDELSYECPDPKYEEAQKAKAVPLGQLPEYQTSITEYLLANPEKNVNISQQQAAKPKQAEKWIYITDVKTRATPSLPTGSSLRPTIIQLHLYHHLLENLVQGNFALEQLAMRYSLNVDETFSDSFLAQLGNLNQEIFSSQGSADEHNGDEYAASQDSVDVLLQHNTLSTLWKFMISQFRETFLVEEQQQRPHPGTETSILPASQQSTSDLPPPPSQPTLLSPLLTASYMASNYKHASQSSPYDDSKRMLGHKSFQFNSAFLHSYLSEALTWWRGEREARGVALQEAWKCRSCDFRNDCAWIHERDQAAFDEALERKKMREMAGVAGRESKGIARSNV